MHDGISTHTEITYKEDRLFHTQILLSCEVTVNNTDVANFRFKTEKNNISTTEEAGFLSNYLLFHVE